ncbi:hypothetical protein J1614_009457 [Plenodomus biglobosus]|nr:hypothetical protein J1614_009457 [Plenodomus biglobosus]
MRPRHVLITGGSRGIGLAIAKLFAKNAYRCTLISRSEQDLKEAVASLTPLPASSSTSSTTPKEDSSQQLSPYKHNYIPSSITSPSFWSTSPADQSTPSSPSFTTFLPKPPRKDSDHASQIDVLVNCAGISQSSLFTRTSEEDIERIITTNLTSVMLSTRFLLRHGYLRKKTLAHGTSQTTAPASPAPSAPSSSSLNEAETTDDPKAQEQSPVIINIASLLAISGGYGAVAYSASKAGLVGFTRALACEYASHGVRVNAILPGYIDTAMTKGGYRTLILICCLPFQNTLRSLPSRFPHLPYPFNRSLPTYRNLPKQKSQHTHIYDV